MKLALNGTTEQENENIFFDQGPLSTDMFHDGDDLFTQLSTDLGLSDFMEEDVETEGSVETNDIYRQYFASSDHNPLFDEIIMSEDTSSSDSSNDVKLEQFSPSTSNRISSSSSNSFPPSPSESDSSVSDEFTQQFGTGQFVITTPPVSPPMVTLSYSNATQSWGVSPSSPPTGITLAGPTVKQSHPSVGQSWGVATAGNNVPITLSPSSTPTPTGITLSQISSSTPTPPGITLSQISTVPVSTASIVNVANLGKVKIAIPKITKPAPVANSTPLVLTSQQLAQLTQSGILKVSSSNQTTTRVITTPQQMAPIVIKTEPLSPLSTGMPTVQTASAPQRFSIQTYPTSTSNDNDLKSMKRQQRMIKNRESACLSRRKKKEYVNNLEDQIAALTKENTFLRQENDNLKRRVDQLESEKNLLTTGLVNNPNVRKGTALLAILFLVSINLNSLGGMYQNQDLSGKRPLDVASSFNPAKLDAQKVGRTLLWAPTDDVTNNSSNSSNSSVPMCPVYFNQTESIRLDNQLRGWFRLDPVSSMQNATTAFQPEKKPIDKNPNRKIYDSTDPDTALDHFIKPTANSGNIYHMRIPDQGMRGQKIGKYGVSKQSTLTVYDTDTPRFDFDSFFDAIHRREDTFYVVSFSGDHLLLPATSRNESVRPRMSLFLPSMTVPVNDSMKPPANHISMMQIDCEVINTGLVHINEAAIPIHLTSGRRSGPRPAESPSPSNSSLQRNESDKSFEKFRTNFDRNGTGKMPNRDNSSKQFDAESDNMTESMMTHMGTFKSEKFVQSTEKRSKQYFGQKMAKNFVRKSKKMTEP